MKVRSRPETDSFTTGKIEGAVVRTDNLESLARHRRRRLD